MKEKLTREKALELHRRMWGDMRKKLGNNPSDLARRIFKRDWLQTHGYEDVECNCFLCEYDTQQKSKYKACEACPIDWFPLSAKKNACCGDQYIYGNSRIFDSIWESAPIDEILNLPEKEGV